MKKLLFITSYFPPLGGPGVQRQLYYIIYSETFGWSSIVLTVKNVIYHVYDPSLLKKISPTTKIFRTESLEFGRILQYIQNIKNIFTRTEKNKDITMKVSSKNIIIGRYIRDWLTIIDDRMLWIPFAMPAALKAIKKMDIDVIVARGGPFSNTIFGMWISKITKLPLVLDLADPWLDYPYIYLPTNFHKAINQYFEHKVFCYASKISVACPEIKKRILSRYPEIPGENIEIITNGFDANEFSDLKIKTEGNSKLIITHVGTLSWIRYEAFRTLCLALNKMIQAEPGIIERLELNLVGDVSPENIKLISEFSLNPIIKMYGYQPHTSAIKIMANADLLFLPISCELSNKEGSYVVPGKLFDYIGSGIPILMVGPKECDAAHIIVNDNLGIVFEPDQIPEIIEFIKSAIINGIQKVVDNNKTKIEKYERKNISKRFYEMLNSAI